MQITLHRHYDHHFRIKGKVNNVPITFLVDTGATSIAISEKLARQAKLPRYAPIHIQTANGMTIGYMTRIKELRFNSIVLKNVRAVISPNLETSSSLLGMNVLKKFRIIQEKDTLTLTIPSATQP